MPTNSPLITVPTIWPRLRSGARCAATGKIICVPVAVTPSIIDAAMNTTALVATADTARLATTPPSVTKISVLFSTRSPSGARNSRPST